MAFENVKLGKLAARSSSKALLFADFLRPQAEDAKPPTEYNFFKRMRFQKRMYGNDVYGNCTRASQANMATRLEHIETGKSVKIADEEVVRVYFDMTWRLYGDGKDGKPMPVDWSLPGGPGDQGAYEMDALSQWRNPMTTFRDVKGRPLTIDAYTKINHFDPDALRRAIWATGGHGIKICFNLPAAWQQGKIWDMPANQPAIGAYAPGSWGGHSTFGDAYTKRGLEDITWDEKVIVTWNGLLTFADEAYWVVDSLDTWQKKASDLINFKRLKEAVNDVSSIKID